MKKWSLLVVSDLHYELPDANFIDDPKELAPDHWAFRDSVFPDFHLLLESLSDRSFDLVAVCGDVTTHGKAKGISEFMQQALPQLTRIAKRPAAVCVVPGNHDVQWGLAPTQDDVFTRKFEHFWPLANRHDVTSCLYPEGALRGRTDDQLSFKHPANGPVYLDEEAKLYALCVNSAIRCGERDERMTSEVALPLEQAVESLEQGGSAAAARIVEAQSRLGKYLVRDIAHVTPAQRRHLVKKLHTRPPQVKSDWARYLRVGVLHHHLVRFPGQMTEHKGYELTVDSADVLKLFSDFDFDLVITGHKHQAYAERYAFGGKHLLLVGGSTVGAQPAGSSNRGIQIIDVEDTEDGRTFRITEVPSTAGSANVLEEVERCRRGGRFLPVSRNLEGVFRDRSEAAGFSYRDVASMTLINADGDARRIIEYEDLVVTDPASGRDRAHAIRLPPTSGYLANLRGRAPRGSGFNVTSAPEIAAADRKQSLDCTLKFDPSIAVGEKASYSCQWDAVNAFALDQQQFDLKYGKLERSDNIEFTHFATTDPVQELTVVVRFPEDFHLDHPPRLRIARRTPDPHSRDWEIDVETARHLKRAHALRYYEAMNIAALRVSRPSPDLSYGIEWDVPIASPPEMDDLRRIESLRPDARGPMDRDAREQLTVLLNDVLAAARQLLLSTWDGPLDASLMWLDRVASPAAGTSPIKKGELVVLAAIAGDQQENPDAHRVRLSYGDGIAGRAIKTNRIKVYVAPTEVANEDGEPDYYTPIQGVRPHQMVVAFPLHLPVGEAEFLGHPFVYERQWPYAVVNVGTTRSDSPLAQFRLPEHAFRLLSFQDQLNRLVHGCLAGIRDARSD